MKDHNIPEYIYHVTTQKKIKKYHLTGYIRSPVRGFNNEKAAMAWAMKTGRKIILKIKTTKAHKLPDHRNPYGEAFWNEDDIPSWECVLSA